MAVTTECSGRVGQWGLWFHALESYGGWRSIPGRGTMERHRSCWNRPVPCASSDTPMYGSHLRVVRMPWRPEGRLSAPITTITCDPDGVPLVAVQLVYTRSIYHDDPAPPTGTVTNRRLDDLW